MCCLCVLRCKYDTLSFVVVLNYFLNRFSFAIVKNIEYLFMFTYIKLCSFSTNKGYYNKHVQYDEAPSENWSTSNFTGLL